MTLEESSQLMTNQLFRGRVKAALLVYAEAILREPIEVPARQTRIRWANQTIQQPDMVANQMQPLVVMDANVQEHGADITDPALQAAVETSVNRTL